MKNGLFVTPHTGDAQDSGRVEVVFQSGMLDDVAQELYSSGVLERNDRGIAVDITPVVDVAIARNA